MAMASHFHRCLTGGISKRGFLTAMGGAVASAARITRPALSNEIEYDVIVIGAGNAGLPTAIFSANRGARVLILEISSQIGGTLLLSGGRMSAAGTKLQRRLGIEDSPDIHFEDVMRLSEGTANPALVRLAVDHAAPAFDWLMDNGFDLADGVPVERGMTHAGQSRARYVWSKDGGIGILNVLEKMIAPHVESGQITVQNNTRVTRLDMCDAGRVCGVYGVVDDGPEVLWCGQNVALTSGGYTSNPSMFAELEGALDYSDVSNPYSQGIGIELGLAAGGYVRGGEDHLPSFGGIPASNDIPTSMIGYIKHHPPERQPWEIWVNAHGKRFIQEDIVSVHEKEIAAVKQPHERFWVVFDDNIFSQAPSLMYRWSRDDIASAFGTEFAFAKANTIEELAAKTGIDPVGLAHTISEFNEGQSYGIDRFGRKHMPAPIQQKPFYAIRMQPSQLVSFAGLGVDSELRVVRTDLSPIPNLYAAGELLGAGQLMGHCYFGGMLVTPALALGRLLGQELINIKT